NLRQEVDPNLPIVPLLCEVNLDEVRQHGDLIAKTVHRLPVHRQQLVWLALLATVRPKEATDDLFGDGRHRERLQRAPNVPAHVTILEPAHHDGVQGRAGDDTELS